MSFKLAGESGNEPQVDSRHLALRSSLRPHDALGAFHLEAITGALAATIAADAPLFSFRNPDAAKKIIINEINVGVVVLSNITTSVLMEIEAIIARSWTVADSAGNVVTPNKAEVTLDGSIADIRIGSTTSLTAGTRTLDAQGIGMLFGISGTTAPVVPLQKTNLYRPVLGASHQIVLGNNEGIIIRDHIAGPASGTWALLVEVDWSELESFDANDL